MLKKLLFLTVLCSAVLSAQSRVGPFDFPVWSPLDTLRAGSTSDTSNSNNGLNSISLKANKWFSRYFSPNNDSLRGVNHGVFDNSLRSNGTLNVTGATVLGGTLNINGNSVFTAVAEFQSGETIFSEGIRIGGGAAVRLVAVDDVTTGVLYTDALTSNRGWLFPDLTGTVGLVGAAQAYTNVKNIVLTGQSTTIAPLKISSGTLLTTPEAGAIENDGTYLYFTRDSGQKDTLNTTGTGAGGGGGTTGGWTSFTNDDAYTDVSGKKVHIRTADGDTTLTTLFNVYGTGTITNTLRVGGSGAADSTLSITGSGHFTTNVLIEDKLTVSDSIASPFFNGSGANLTSLNGTNITTGTVAAARLPNAALGVAGIVTTGTQTFDGEKTFADGLNVSANNFGFSDGTVVAGTGILTWTLPNESGTLATRNGGQTWASTTIQTNFNADLLDGSSASAFASSSHNHAASNITSGTLSDSRLSSNVPLKNASVNTFTGAMSVGGNLVASGSLVQVDGTLSVDGKINAGGGVDPPYVSFTSETRQTIAEKYAKDVKPTEEVMQFWNTETQRFEFYHLKKKKFFTFDGIEIVLTQK